MFFNAPRNTYLEVPITNTPQQVKFGDQPTLRNAMIKALIAPPVTVVPVGPTNGQPNLSLTDMVATSLDLYQGNNQVVYKLPLLTLNPFNDGTSPFMQDQFRTFNYWLSWDKCLFTRMTGTYTSGTTLILQVFYCLPGDVDPDTGLVVAAQNYYQGQVPINN